MKLIVLFLVSLCVAGVSNADGQVRLAQDSNFLDRYNPFAENAEQILIENEVLNDYAFVDHYVFSSRAKVTKAYHSLVAMVSIQEQRLYLYEDDELIAKWKVSTGAKGHTTPKGKWSPDADRIYKKYSSKKYPGGDYKGLGNMPYAVFYNRGFAIHGTGTGNWKYLGQPASHGCTRVHPDNAAIFNNLVKAHGPQNVLIEIY